MLTVQRLEPVSCNNGNNARVMGKGQARIAAIPAELTGWVETRLVNAHVRIVRMMVLGTLLNACALLLVLFGDVPSKIYLDIEKVIEKDEK